MTKYIIEIDWDTQAEGFNIPVQDMLRHARLPEDLFARKNPTVTADEYFRLWGGIEYIMRNVPAFPLALGKGLTPETFSPTIFACACSQNLTVALKRVAKYKPLIGPLRFDIAEQNNQLKLEVRGIPGYEELPATMVTAELVFWVQVTRMATREQVAPAAVYVNKPLDDLEQYAEYFGVPVRQGDFNGIVFSLEDATKPFLAFNQKLWSMFEPELNRRLQDLTHESSFRERVRACLIELLASGQYSVADVASKLAISTRTLQRRLSQENTNFQQELDNLREELARHYLSNSDYTSNQIAFLLGYEEPTSFFRAFRTWTGHTPESIRSSIQ